MKGGQENLYLLETIFTGFKYQTFEFELSDFQSFHEKNVGKKLFSFVFRIFKNKPPSSTLASNPRGRNFFLILHSETLPFSIVYLGRKSEASKNSFWQVAPWRVWVTQKKKRSSFICIRLQ